MEFMPHKAPITGVAFTMVSVRENIILKRRGKLSAGVLLLHDNALADKSRKSRADVRKRGYGELNHPPYILKFPVSTFSSETLKISEWATISR